MKTREFLSKNLVIIVMVPALLGVHYGWYRLQDMESLVKPEEKIEFPLKSIFKKMFMEDDTKEKKGVLAKSPQP